MSNLTYQDCGNGVTASQNPAGFDAIQVSDFFSIASLLHPITVGAIAIVTLFLYLRLSSNRCVAPVTLFDWIINVALGSTLAGIVNGTSLLRGLISLVTLLLFQLILSYMSSNYGSILEHAINAPPLVIAFRGRALDKVMAHHRVSKSDLNGALRRFGIWNISQIEAVIIEPTGEFTIYKQNDCPEGVNPEVLMDVPGYRRLVEHFDKEGIAGCSTSKKDKQLNKKKDGQIANDLASREA
ncbi:hypothetical protein BD324DRAFT_620100 [Kockovaella imperatae]|uniref:YetF C-terminal domain-containing protein n=1 Tax=Kockovaella imperatae TaxID=4999 RepID=A0A1Y1UJK6_9TREE|nr:hypothetical protein BD324DRAFT_620100 [Kockovaella imperatae]ORX38233.1 hypothetical protein BD324DRAFT_620100 [Kockovaella imperatae]